MKFNILMKSAKKIYTCTQKSFSADNGFRIRDTGLICRHLRILGADSKCVMVLPAHEEAVEPEYVIRTTGRDLMRAAWWKELHPDGIVLYS